MTDISHDLPHPLRDRVTIIAPKTSQLKRVVTEDMDTKSDALGLPLARKKRKAEQVLLYGPSVLTENASQEKHPLVLDSVSTRISGAMIIDPHVRKLADSANMKLSEHAVWLMVVAVKEFSKALLLKTLSTIKAVDAGRIPSRLTKSNIGQRNAWVTDDDTSTKSSVPTERLKCITSSDLHSVIANLPTTTRSLSGWVSRSVFERSLNASLNSSLVLGGNAFYDVKKYIVSSISPPVRSLQVETSTATLPIQVIHSGLDHGDLERLKGRKSPLMRGLGRGAKDLAALKARATTIKPESDSVKRTEPFLGATASNTETSNLVDVTTTPSEPPVPGKCDNVNVLDEPHNTEDGLSQALPGSCSILEHVSGSLSLSEQNSAAFRRGKGHGVKNLAMMRARSVTSSTDLTEDVASASTALLEAPEGNQGGKSSTAEIESPTNDDVLRANMDESIEPVKVRQNIAGNLASDESEKTPGPALVDMLSNSVLEASGASDKSLTAQSIATAAAIHNEQLPQKSNTTTSLSGNDQPSSTVFSAQELTVSVVASAYESKVPTDSILFDASDKPKDAATDQTAE